MSPAMDEVLRKGVKSRFPMHVPNGGTRFEIDIAGCLEIRHISEAPAIIAVTGSEAAVCLRFMERRKEYAGFIGKDEAFYLGTKDLFEYYWC